MEHLSKIAANEVAPHEALREMQKRMGEFIAYFEIAEEKMASWRNDIERSIGHHQLEVASQLAEVRYATEELRGFMDDIGAARLNQRLQRYLEQGQEHVETLQKVGEQQIQRLVEKQQELDVLARKSIERLDRASNYTVKNISDALNSFRLSDFQQLTEQNCDAVQETSQVAIHQLEKTVKWFHWKNLALALAITLLASFTMGLYINNELPWESHEKVVLERNAGQTLLKAWPKLSQVEQERIIHEAQIAIA